MRALAPIARWCVALGVLAGTLLFAAPAHAQTEQAEAEPAPESAVEAYLERLGLTRLLATALEERIEALPKAKRAPTAERLGKVYVNLLGEAGTDAERVRWEDKARALLSLVPETESIELRISVNRAIYDRAEAIAERVRLRLATADEGADVSRSLRTLAGAFSEIGMRAHRRVEQLERIENTGDITDRAREDLAEARRLRSLAFYYAGWSSCYVALLNPPPSPGMPGDPAAAEALRSFGWLFGALGRPATLDRLPNSLLQYEHIARAAIGCALASSVRDGASGADIEALKWLDAVEQSTDVPASVREQVPVRRMSVFASARRWADLERLVRTMRRGARGPRDTPRPLAPPVARLLAILTLEADRKYAPDVIESLARTAMGDLIEQKELTQVLDLVGRYGTATLGDSGFVALYVKGVLEYEAARKAHTAAADAGSEPTADADTVAKYRAAARLLDSASRQSDAEQFQRERIRSEVTRGLALFYVGDFERAAEVLASAWSSGPKTPDAEETLWASVLAWNKAVEKNIPGAPAKREQAAALFLQTYPESANAPRLILMQSASGQISDEDALKALATIPPESPVFQPARRQMARLLYSRSRAPGVPAAERAAAAREFIEVAEGLFQEDSRIARDPDGKDRTGAAERALARARQILDVILSAPSPDGERAAALLKRVRDMATIASIDLAPVQGELLLREAQIALATGDEPDAIAAADALHALPDHGAQYGGAAERLVYRRLAQQWSAATDEADGGVLGDNLLRIGLRIIERAGLDPAQLRDPGMIALHHTLASAATIRFKRSGDTAMRDIAARLDKTVLAREPGSEPALRRLAENSDSAGDTATAMECWRILLDGSPTGSEAWFEARFHTLRLLAASDPERVRVILAQHVALYPDFGPEPWRSRLRDLAQSVGFQPASAPAAPDPAPAPSTDGGSGGGGGGAP